MTNTADTELIGTILTGMIQQGHATTNNLIDIHLDDAIDWATKFEKLYQRIEYAVESGNILAAHRVLESFGYDYDDVPRAVEHYQAMKMGGQ